MILRHIQECISKVNCYEFQKTDTEGYLSCPGDGKMHLGVGWGGGRVRELGIGKPSLETKTQRDRKKKRYWI
jgi:hypothetical protein